jgi:hypothetical protein
MGRLFFLCNKKMGLERWRFFPAQLGTKNAVMQLFNEIQQFRTGAGADK